ncbi:acyltransferase [Lachnoclostridium sp. An169]|uniref:acyltransferase family protein n=1 Tax=Lachnoclostridium sp. An169 TaxID=1965569 RepID=UPI000B389158|nr:acyltransferase [Lachnoclostridium sp. An169]OUP80852.1 acyltransferase [Lachnoclostridium sp. An169]
MTAQGKNRIVWIDSMKLFACLLVVVGHLYMSMEAGGWIAGDAFYYCFPIQTVYTFHVPLFFVCSGYLYQCKKVEYSVRSHINNIKNKALNLGVPYLLFTLITLMLKIIFSDAVNNQATPVIRTIFWEPVAPYWYLYALFFIFCVIPRQKNKNNLVLIFLISVIAKILYVFIPWPFTFPDIIGKVVGNAIWFSFGMILTDCELRKKILNKAVMAICFIIGVLLSLIYYRVNCDSMSVQFIIAAMFVYAFVCLFAVVISEKGENIVPKLSKYFMPVFLIHTIVAAGFRTILLKIGINSFSVHFSAGLLVSILVPVLLYEIARRKWWLLFWIEPSKAIKMKREKYV